MSLLYHAYVYLEFLILACTIYILAPQNLDESKYKSGGRKRPQNSKVGAESAPKMSKWGQKVPPQFGHDKIRTEVKIKVGAESAPKITKWGQKAPPK